MSGNLLLTSDRLDEIYALVGSSGTTSYLRDGINSTVASTSASGTISGNYYYSPYGDSTSTDTAAIPYQFTGREDDGATGLYYYRARYYAPQLGRFISEDPIGLGGGTNYYAYALGNPVSLIDPQGLYPAIQITWPNGSTSIPMTVVKNPVQAAAFGLPVGTPTAIAVPPGANPQGAVDCWNNAPDRGLKAFRRYWADPSRNYKVVSGPMYDAYGNFMYGGTGAADYIDLVLLQLVAQYLHSWNNDPINSRDIMNGYDAVAEGGRLSIIDYNPPAVGSH
jgi:RHS repeat-associated protein